ncbi:MAG TPA: serine/threonine protein kinase, partial [Planctomycetes bacterium]|nr:serine/threonine protein kinase [Planctomycetota bacterium]
GVVYRARELSTGREVALKTLTFYEPEEVARLEREGQALAQVAHPNLLRVHRADRHAGRPLLVLELAAGGSLAQRLTQGPLAWEEAVHAGRRSSTS